MKLTFDPNRHRLTVTIFGDIKEVDASSTVRNEINERRPLGDPAQVVKAMTHDPYNDYPVMPRTFPAGKWNVGRPRRRHDKYLAPFYIPTNAEQYLSTWALDEAGGYEKPDDGSVLDIGYGLHYSTSRTTVGCIRIHNLSDLEWLVDRINEILEKRDIVWMQAKESI